MKTLVVISKYNEDVSWVDKINHEVLIYDKSETPVKNSISRPNIGREAETLLYYIITNYNNLPDLTIFLQGDPRSNPVKYTYEEVIDEINKYHAYELKTILTWEGCTDLKEYWLKNCKILNDVLFDTDNDIVKYSSGVQYVIPKNLILNRPLDMYKKIHDSIIKFGNNPLVAERENLDLGIDAWTIELIWGNIFNYNKKLKSKYSI
jgi:hypothetical protein